MYYTTGFSRCEIEDLCALVAEIESSVPVADRRDWPPILGLGNSVVVTLTYRLVHPKPIRQLRDLTRYRSLIRERTREKQRLEKLLEDAQIKLSSVISDVFGVSGRQMLAAMIAGQRSPKVLAQMARGSMRSRPPCWRRR